MFPNFLAQHLQNADSMLRIWREERSERLTRAMAIYGAALAALATVLDSAAGSLSVLKYDFVLIGGCLTSALLIRSSLPEKWRRSYAWLPMFVSFWVRTIPNCLLTGGINSPFLGIFSALLLIAGILLRAKNSVGTMLLLSCLNVVAWDIREQYYPLSPPGALPSHYTAVILFICLAGIAAYLRSLTRTELQLTSAAVESSKKLAEAGDRIAREEAANLAKITFLANVSHELRTPLGAIVGYTELLRDDSSSAQEKTEFLDTIFRNATQLARLVNDLLDLSKAESGHIQLELLEFDARDLFYDALETFSLPAKNKNLALRIDFESTHFQMKSDPNRIKQILINLLGNAIKFTATGEVRIRVKTEPRPPSERVWLMATFRDQGCGIAAQDRDSLFKPFSQADHSIARKYGGTGLGLHLSRQLARTLGGDLTLAWTQEGQGCEFLLELPLVQLDA